MKLVVQFLGCFLLGCVVTFVIFVFSSSPRQLGRNLERAALKRVSLENVTLREIAAIMQTNLVQQGVLCRIIVDNEVANNPIPRFLVGDANGIFWLHGVADVFECRFEICEDNIVLLCKR